jgi:CheY-like chemotaxis protein
VPATEGEPGGVAHEKPFNVAAVHFAHATVLVVDDVDYNRDLVRGYYQGYDLEVVEAQDGSEGLEKAARLRPDLILLDLKMPVLDGYAVAGRLRADEALRRIPVLVFTASALAQDEERISPLCDGYLRKPVRREDLIRATMVHLPHAVATSMPAAAPAPALRPDDIARRVAALSAEVARELDRAIDIADIATIERLIEQLRRDDHVLANILTGHAERFDYDALRAVLGHRAATNQ